MSLLMLKNAARLNQGIFPSGNTYLYLYLFLHLLLN